MSRNGNCNASRHAIFLAIFTTSSCWLTIKIIVVDVGRFSLDLLFWQGRSFKICNTRKKHCCFWNKFRQLNYVTIWKFPSRKKGKSPLNNVSLGTGYPLRPYFPVNIIRVFFCFFVWHTISVSQDLWHHNAFFQFICFIFFFSSLLAMC